MAPALVRHEQGKGNFHQKKSSSVGLDERRERRNVATDLGDDVLFRALLFFFEDSHEAAFQVLESVQVLGVVGPEEDELTHVGVPLPLDVLAAQVAQLPDDDVDQHVEVVGVEKLMAVIVLDEIEA